MALRIDTIRDIRKYEPKLVGPFSARQLIYLVISLSYSIPIAIAVPTDITNKILIGAVLAAPIMLGGYIKIDNTPLEMLALRILYKKITPQKRKYKSGNIYKKELLKIRSSEEKKANAKTVKYSTSPDYKLYQ